MKSLPHLDRRKTLAMAGSLLATSTPSPGASVLRPSISRVCRGRALPTVADKHESYLRAVGLPLLERTARGLQLFREDRRNETWFVAISYWLSIDDMTAFTKGDPKKVHHLPRDSEFLIELPDRIGVYRILLDHHGDA